MNLKVSVGNVSKVTLERVDKGWLYPVSVTALQHALSPIPSLFEQFLFFTTACIIGEKFVKFWHIPKIYVQRHPMSVFFFQEIKYLIYLCILLLSLSFSYSVV
jgi:hypothetical protein